MSVGIISRYFLIESPREEQSEALQIFVASILQSIVPERPVWWHPFDIGDCFQYGDRTFREFRCIAGSVSCHLQVRARREDGIPRALIYFATEDEVEVGYEIRGGKQYSFDPSEVRPITHEFDDVPPPPPPPLRH